MNWDAIHATGQVQSFARAPLIGEGMPRSSQPQGATRFGEMIGTALGEVNEKLLATQTDLQQLAVGNVQNLHQIMIRLEESRLSFQLLMQVRNRLLEAYQDIMKMQL